MTLPGLLPGPVIPGWNKDSLGHTPRAPHPADREPAAHAEAGDGHRALARSYRTTDIAAPPNLGYFSDQSTRGIALLSADADDLLRNGSDPRLGG